MIRACGPADAVAIASVINDAARAYRGLVPDRFLHEPYMPLDELERELRTVSFHGYEDGGQLVGVIGLEPVEDTTLLRHAYVSTDYQRRGVGEQLLARVESLTETPELLLGTWEDAWAVSFYLKHGYEPATDKDALLARYWPRVGRDQAAHSVVLRKRLRRAP